MYPLGPRRLPEAALIALALTVAACGGDDPLAPDQAVTPVEAGGPAALVTAQRIVFSSKRNGQYDIYKMDPAGQNVVRLTSKPDDESQAAWSADGKRVALVRPRLNAANKVMSDIYIINADGSNGHWARSTATTCPLSHPSWSPDGSRLALSLYCSGTQYVGYLILNTGQLGGYSTGFGGLPGSWPTYTKSGQIVYLGGTAKTVDRINADGSGHKTLFSSTTVVIQPALSPDGSKLLFVRTVWDALPNADIYMVVLGTGKTTQLTWFSGSDSQPTWSPDGTRIAFTSGLSGVSQIWTMNPTGGSLARLTKTTTPEVDPSWSR
jgi:Tol biopolymer transport system component